MLFFIIDYFFSPWGPLLQFLLNIENSFILIVVGSWSRISWGHYWMALLEHCFLDAIISVVAERDTSSCWVSCWVSGWVGWGGIPRVTSRSSGGMAGRNFAWKIIDISSVVCASVSSLSVSLLRDLNSVTFYMILVIACQRLLPPSPHLKSLAACSGENLKRKYRWIF